MKKTIIFLIMLSFVCVCSTACVVGNGKPKPNMIQSKRRFADYVSQQQQKDPNSIDLSEGPKLKYDARFGPQNLDFDIKIIDPYKY